MSAPGMLRFRAANQRADWRDPWPDYERLLSTVRELDGRYRAALSLYGSALQHEDRPALLSEARRLLIDLGTAPQVRDPEKAVRPIAASSTGPAMLATLTRLKYLALYNAGMIAAELGQHGQAIETLLQAVAVSPERISAWSAVAQSASATGNYRLCKTACEAVLKIEPKDDDGAVVDMLIRTLYIVDNVPAAAQLYAAYGPNAFSPEIRVLMDELVGQVSATAAAQQELEFTPNQHTLLAPAAQQRLKQLKQAHRTHREKEAAESAVPLSCRTIEIEADISWKALAKLLSQTCQVRFPLPLISGAFTIFLFSRTCGNATQTHRPCRPPCSWRSRSPRWPMRPWRCTWLLRQPLLFLRRPLPSTRSSCSLRRTASCPRPSTALAGPRPISSSPRPKPTSLSSSSSPRTSQRNEGVSAKRTPLPPPRALQQSPPQQPSDLSDRASK